MRKTILSTFALYATIASAQMTDLPVSASQTTVVSGQNVQIITIGSQIGYQYALRDDANNTFVDGPVQGTGGDLIFNTGAITSNTSYNVYGTNGFAATLSYSNDRINLSNHERSIDKEVTVAAWIKTASSSGLRNIVLDYGPNDAGFVLRIDGNGKITFDGRDGTNTYKSSGPSSTVVTDNQWHYVVGAANLNTGEWGVAVDGVPESFNNNGVGVSFINTSYLNIGYTYSSSNAYVGQIRDVTVWNQTLSGQVVLANMSDCLDGAESGVVAHFPLSEGMGNEVVDYSSFGINGTISSGTFPWVGNTSNCKYDLEMSQIINVTVGVGSGIFVDSIIVEGFGGADSIVSVGGTLQMTADVFPLNADDGTYTWSVVNGTGSATISASGLLTGISNGSIHVTATANDGSGIIGTSEIVLINQSVGLTEVTFQKVNIYPNPAKNQLFIELYNQEVTEITIIDYSGRIVKTISNSSVKSIDVSGLTQGIYVLKISTKNGVLTNRFVKQ